MKVLQINSVCGIGSTGRIATDIHNMLIDEGHESYIAYGRGTPKNCDNAIKIGANYDIYGHVALTRIFDRHGFGSKKATQNLIKEIEKIDPGIIHLHNIHGYYINIELLFDYLKRVNKPVVWTLHDCWAFTGHCAHFDFIGCEKWKDSCGRCPQKKIYPASLFIDNSKESFEIKKMLFKGISKLLLVSPSQWLSGLVEESFLGEYPVRVINNGIDTNIFKQGNGSAIRSKFGITNEKFVILGVASDFENERKGFNYFMELAKRLESDDITLVLVGISEKQCKQLPPNVRGVLRTENVDELVLLYSMADVFVNPTFEDNFPTVNLEAMACGTPVVSFDTGGVSEQIIEDCGEVVPKGDMDALLAAIFKVEKQGKKKYQMECIKHIRNNYSQNDKYRTYMKLYEELM